MTIQPILFFNLVASVLVLGVALAVLAIFYAKMLKKLHEVSLLQEKMRQGMRKKAQVLLDESQEKSSQIIEKAQMKALDLINSAQFYNEENKHVFEDELKKARDNQSVEFDKTSEDFMKSYQKALQELHEEDIKGLHKVTEDIEKTATTSADDFARVIEEETLSAQKIVEEKIEEEYQKLKVELDAYKKSEYEKISNNIFHIIRKVAEKVLSKGISFDNQEQLVIEALEEAKKQLPVGE